MKAKGLAAGFTDVLSKPIRKATLLEALVAHRGETNAPGDFAPPLETPHSVASEKNRIQVEEGMEDVVPRYLEKRRADVPVYAEALAKDDFLSIRHLAHKMKGTGTGYGFPVLTELGGAMEKGAIEGDAVQIRESLNQLALYLDSIELKYIGE
jgi:HPt (histidine-containing phosphotransfer) domain-containing protein